MDEELANKLVAGIGASRGTMPIGTGGKPILRLLKSGVWVYGQQNDQVQEGSDWAISPLSIQHGFTCWSDFPGSQKNEKLGEVLSSIFDPLPPMPDPIQGYPFKKTYHFDLKCISGDDEDVEVIYMPSSYGGMKAADALLAEIQRNARENRAYPVAIVQLDSDSYSHAKWGETFNPIMEVVDWMDLNGKYRLSDDKKTANVATPAPAEAAPQPTRAGDVPRRQRPAARV
jgi:hypothetical protein